MRSSEVEYIKNVKNAKPFSIKDKLGYLLGDLGFNSLQVLVNTYLMLFCVNVIGIKAIHFLLLYSFVKPLTL